MGIGKDRVSMSATEVFRLSVVLCSVVLAVFMGRLNGVDTGVNRMQQEAIERGYAEYNSTTGKWQWKGDVTE
jgi:hypothetical protein